MWTIQFVDSISATPTIRLSVNDGNQWVCRGFSAGTPRLRRSVSSNAMRDGINVSSSNYDARTLTLDLMLKTTTQDAGATELQKLARELDRPGNVLRYQPEGASKPVFFNLYRSDFSQLDDVMGPATVREFTIELLAEPTAQGLQENFSSTFGIDGSTTGFEYSCPTILGDVAAPLTLDLSYTVGLNPVLLAASATPSSLTAQALVRAATNATLGTVGTDTTSTTGAGATYWNGDYRAVSFATDSTLVDRLTLIQPTLRPGTYRLIARIASASGSNVYRMRAIQTDSASLTVPGSVGATKTWTGTAGLAVSSLDLGLFRVPYGIGSASTADGYTPGPSYWTIQAGRDSTGTGAQDLRIDGLLWVPTIMDDGTAASAAIFDPGVSVETTGTKTVRLSTPLDDAFIFDSTDSSVSAQYAATTRSGGLPSVYPGCTNYLWLTPVSDSGMTSTTFTARYNPRYLFVRPSAS